MTIDKEKLKALASEAIGHPLDSIRGMAFQAVVRPHVMLALLAEIEGLHAQHGRDSGELRKLCSARDSARRQRDQLKAENEALRSALGDCADELAAEIICKNGGLKPEDMHPVTRRLYERDMAAVLAARAAMAKEASHG